jgi:hypothetical protein
LLDVVLVEGQEGGHFKPDGLQIAGFALGGQKSFGVVAG